MSKYRKEQSNKNFTSIYLELVLVHINLSYPTHMPITSVANFKAMNIEQAYTSGLNDEV